MSTKWHTIAEATADLVERKNAAYGDSFAKAAQYLQLLFPNGISPEKYGDMLYLVRDFDKSMRIATAKGALGEDPVLDKLGYALLQAATALREEPVRQYPNYAYDVDGRAP